MNKDSNSSKTDVLCIAAHSDDIDATIGGTLALLSKRGYEIEIIDLTERKGMYFSEEEVRGDEANTAASILGVRRTVIDLGLLRIENNYENRVIVADLIRSRRPDIVITLNDDETHPDHKVVHQLVLDAYHYSFASAIKTDLEPWRAKALYFTLTNLLYELPPQNALLLDISETFEVKKEALKAYASQMLFHSHNKKFGLEHVEAMNVSWGRLIGKDYAEMIVPRVPQIVPFPELRLID